MNESIESWVDAGTMANRFFSQCQKREAKKFMQGKQSKAKNYLFISFLVQINEDKDKDNNTNNTQRNRTKDKLIVENNGKTCIQKCWWETKTR